MMSLPVTFSDFSKLFYLLEIFSSAWSPEPKMLFPQLLGRVFKKQEISQQVLFHNFHLIDYFDSNNQERN